MPDDPARNEWITRVLGFQFASTVQPSRSLPLWQAAKDSVDDQLRTLSDVLRKSGRNDLMVVSDVVAGLLDEVRMEMATALIDLDKRPTKPEFVDAALDAVESALDWLGSDGRIGAVDANPFGVAVTVDATVGAALRQLQSDLTRRAGA